MFKRLVVLCCILLLPTIAAADGTRNYGDFWVGGQIGGVFTPNKDVTFSAPRLRGSSQAASRLIPRFQLAPLSATTSACHTGQPGKGISAWLWTSNGTNSTTQGTSLRRVRHCGRRLRGTSSLSPSWAGSSTPSWEVKGSPEAGSCRS